MHRVQRHASPQTTPAEPIGRGGRDERALSKFLEGVPDETRRAVSRRREKALEDPKLQRLRKDAQRANREFFKAHADEDVGNRSWSGRAGAKSSMEFRARRAWSEAGLSALSEEERQKLLSVMAKWKAILRWPLRKKKKWDAVTTS